MFAPTSRAVLIVVARVSPVMIKIGTVRFSLLVFRRMA